MKILMAVLTTALCLSARAEWALVDALCGSDANLIGQRTWDALWPFHSDQDYLYESVTIPNGPLKSEIQGGTVSRGEGDWAPEQIYRCQRWISGCGQSASTYPQCTFTNLVPNAAYRVCYLGAETYFSSAGSRVFNIEINGTRVTGENGLDLYRDSGKFVACTRYFDATADGEGTLRVRFTYVANNAQYGGLALYAASKPSDVQMAYSAADGRISYSAKDALAYIVQTADSENGPWRDVLLELAKGRASSVSADGASYYRVVASNDLGTVTSEAVRGQPAEYALIDAVYADPSHSNIPSSLDDDQKASLWPFRSDTGLPSSMYYTSMSIGHDLAMSEKDWAPKNVYLIQRYFAGQTDAVRVSFTNLTPYAAYRVDYLGSELDGNARGGSRIFSIAVNGITVDPDIDLYREAGNRTFVASTRSYQTRADASGRVTVSFTKTKDCSKYGGLALFGVTPPHDVTLSFDSATSELVFSAREALTCRLQRALSPEGPWEDFALLLAANGATLRHAAAPGEYFRVVAEGCGEAASAVVKASVPAASEDVPVYAWNLGPAERACGRFATADGFTGKPEQFELASAIVPLTMRTDGLMPTEVARRAFKAVSLSYTFPNLRPDRTYLVRAYAVNASSVLAVADQVEISGVSEYAYVADGKKLSALEVVEKAGDGTPLKAVARATAFSGGVAVTPVAQCGGTTFEIRRNGTTIATGVGRTWVDREGTGSDSYSARAVSPLGVAGEWSEAVMPTAGREFLGVCHSVLVATYGGRPWSSMLDYWVSSSGSRFDADVLDRNPLRGYVDFYDDFPEAVLYRGYWINDRSEGIKLCLDGLVPGMTYRVRTVTGDDWSGSAMVAGRILNVRVNDGDLVRRIDTYKAHNNNGADRWIALETLAVASGRGTIHYHMTAGTENDQWPQLRAVSATLENPCSAAGARMVADEADTRVTDGWFDAPSSDVYAFRSAALAEGRLFIDDRPVTGPVALGAGLHRFRLRTMVSAEEPAMTVEASSLAATDVAAFLSHEAADDTSLGDGWQVRGPGDAYRVGTDSNGRPIWRLLAFGGAFRLAKCDFNKGEISFRVRIFRDYNAHGLALSAFAGDSRIDVTATENGPVCGEWNGIPVWVKVKCTATDVSRLVSKDGVNWTELDKTARTTDTCDFGISLFAPVSTPCMVEIDNVNVSVKRVAGLLILVK